MSEQRPKPTVTRKRLDPRIVNFVRHGRFQHQRSFVIVRGRKACDAVPILCGLLDTVVGPSSSSSLLWCFHKSSGFSLRRQKLFRRYQKRKKVGTLVEDDGNALRAFIARTDVRFCFYTETRNILGRTYGSCVLQDADLLTPNVLARSVETVQGGGLIFLLLPKWTADVPLEEVAGEGHTFLLSLLSSLLEHPNCLIVDDALDISFVPPAAARRLKVEPQAPTGGKWTAPDALELKELQHSLQVSDSPFSPLVTACRTLDQARSLLVLLEMLVGARDKTASSGLAVVTAARGRGKSAVLGLGVVAGLESGLHRILVTSPSAENVSTLLQFVLRGLQRLGLEEMVDYQVHYVSATQVFGGSGLAGKIAHKIVVQRRGGTKQIVRYAPPNQAVDAVSMGATDLLCIDEAAAIPTPLLRDLLTIVRTQAKLSFLASTVSGYEGTGQAMVRLMMAEAAPEVGWGVVRSSELFSAIRYAPNDPVEAWLGQLLCLEATLGPSSIAVDVPATGCRLWAVNRALLFAWEPRVRALLSQVASLLAVSDAVTSPDQLQRLADSPEERLFVLLPPKEDWPADRSSLPVACVIQAHMEGGPFRQQGQAVLEELRQCTADAGLAKQPVLVVTRLATHPDLRNRGFATRALQLLVQALRPREDEGKAWSGRRLLCEAEEVPSDGARFLAVRVAAQAPLLRLFVARVGCAAVEAEAEAEELSGERRCLLMRALRPEDEEYVRRKHDRFRRNLACGRRPCGPFAQLPPEEVSLLSGGAEDPHSDVCSEIEDVASAEPMDTEAVTRDVTLRWWPRDADVSLDHKLARRIERAAANDSGQRHLLLLLGASARLLVPELRSLAPGPLLWVTRERPPAWRRLILQAVVKKKTCARPIRSLAVLLAADDVTWCSHAELLEGRHLGAAPFAACVLEGAFEASPTALLVAAAAVRPSGGLLLPLAEEDPQTTFGNRLFRGLFYLAPRSGLLWEAVTPDGEPETITSGSLKPPAPSMTPNVSPDCLEGLESSLAAPLLGLCRGDAQTRLLAHVLAMLVTEDGFPPRLLVTGARGAGRSFVLGLAASAALASGRSSVLLCGASPRHARSILVAAARGLRELGPEEVSLDLQELRLQFGARRAAFWIPATSPRLPTVLGAGEADLVLAAEAAALPEAVLASLRGLECPVLLAQATSGPGLPGASLQGRLARLEMTEWPLQADWRPRDDLDQWLAGALAVPNGGARLLASAWGLPHPDLCVLMRLDRRAALADGNSGLAAVLAELRGADLPADEALEAVQRLWDEPGLEAFVLMPNEAKRPPEQLLRCLCLVTPSSDMRAEVRLFARPGEGAEGYAERTVQLVAEYLRGELLEPEAQTKQNEVLLNVAFLRPSPSNLEAITAQLPLSDAASLRVLRAASFRPVALREGASFLRLALPLSEAGRVSVLREQKDFRRRFLRASGGIARLPAKVSFDLMAMASKELPVEPLEKVEGLFAMEDLLQLEELAAGLLLDPRPLRRALWRLLRLYMLGRLPEVTLFPMHLHALIGVGGKQLPVAAVAAELGASFQRTVEPDEVALYLRWAVRRLFKAVRELLEKDTARELGLEHLESKAAENDEDEEVLVGREGLAQLEAELDAHVAQEARSQKAKLAALLEALKKEKPVAESGAFAARKRTQKGAKDARRKGASGGRPAKRQKLRR